MNGMSQLLGIVGIAVAVAVASFSSDVAATLGVTTLVIAGFVAIGVLVGAAVATRYSRGALQSGRAPSLDATPAISPLQEQ